MLLNSLVKDLRVTSVLNDDNKSYGEQFLLDGREDTCWNSECGLPQSIFMTFGEQCSVETVCLMFQGGFVGTVCEILVDNSLVFTIFPKDVNELQEFKLQQPVDVDSSTTIELRFTMSSDFYGRITVYMIELHGSRRQ